MESVATLTCPLCGLEHRRVTLLPGEKAVCTRCDSVMSRGRRSRGDAPLAWCVTGLLLAPPACFLPFMSAGKLGAERVSALFTGVGALWGNGMRALGALVLCAGGILPVALLAILGLLLASAKFPALVPLRGALARAASALEEAAIPEVQVLAILVALTRLGGLVHVRMLAGFWCYCAMSLCLLLAEHGFDLRELEPGTGLGRSPVAT